MTKPKSKQRPPLINQTLEGLHDTPPLEIKNQQSLETLRNLIREAFSHGDLPYGIEGIEHRLLVAAHKARIVYKSAPRELSQLEELLASIEDLAPSLIGLIELVKTHNLVRKDHWNKVAQEIREKSGIERQFEISSEEITEMREEGISVFDPEMVEQFPLETTRYGLQILLSAVTSELSAIDKQPHVSVANRPETEVIAYAIREIQKDAHPDRPTYLGSEEGPLARLYSHICDLAGFAPGDPISTLRKPYSYPGTTISGRFLESEKLFK